MVDDVGEVRLKPCLFCKAEVRDLRAVIDPTKDAAEFQVRCSACGAVGPVGRGTRVVALKNAVDFWNNPTR